MGLYGGSFNPAHSGHLHVAQTARRNLRLDRVVWLVSPQNPLKATDQTAALERRMERVKTLAKGPANIVSDLESRAGVQFTIDTVRLLKARFPEVCFVWIMGADSLATFHRWRGWADIARELPICVVARPGASLRGRLSPAARRFPAARKPADAAGRLSRMPPPAWTFLTAPLNFESSTRLRVLERNGKSSVTMSG